jgi:hypothetical protein
MGTSRVSNTHREAGQYVQARADQLGARLPAFAGVSLLVIGVAFFAFDARGSVLIAIELLALAAMWLADRTLSPQIANWSQGARGERKVGAILEDLGSDWRVLHDVSLGRGNIDHILVGPGGAFTIETKSRRGQIGIDQIDEHMLKQAYAEKKLLEKISGLKVEALLVFSEAWLIGSPPARRRGVTVLPARMLAGCLQGRRPIFSNAEAEEIGERLRLALEVDAA